MSIRKCKDCGATNKKLSHKGLCFDCSMIRMKEVGMQIKNRKGKYFKRYKKSMIKFLGLK